MGERTNGNSLSADNGIPNKRRKPSERANISNNVTRDPGAQFADANSDTLSTSSPSPTAFDRDHRLEEIRFQKAQLSAEEQQLLNLREKSSKQQITDLTKRLKLATKSAEQAHRIKTQSANQKVILQQRITQLLSKNAELEELLQRSTESTPKPSPATNPITDLRQKLLKASNPSQRELYFKTSELQEARMKISELETEKISLRKRIQDLDPTANRVQDLERKLKLANDVIVGLGGAAVEDLPKDGMQCEPEDASIEEEGLSIEYENFGANFRDSAVNGNNGRARLRSHSACSEYIDDLIHVSDGEDSSTSLHMYEEDENGTMMGQSEQEQESNKIWVGKYYVEPSDPKYLEISWKTQYTRKGRQYACNSCSTKSAARTPMEDHIWQKHYEGHFKCPVCNERMKLRYDIKKHMETMHTL